MRAGSTSRRIFPPSAIYPRPPLWASYNEAEGHWGRLKRYVGGDPVPKICPLYPSY
ncbi:hypothetical protein Sulac_3568 (plasmid) [Sulfobacillus acidophilus DSM 10332]|uniref:Uncharacterized protein n=1 Tax=Sulfobacillus acidophilus (strain ATCC 700253 / DSM 10332 / NAL) TaxID=679936 RepID=G8U1S1_SULAD|nr:hypothetical protein Sulac_3568 [Sulfobacillus acidophilus DSM 10332]